MTEGLEQGILIGVIATGIRLATPYLLAALGEMLSQRAGVFNLGLEGIMLMGAFAGFYITYVSQSPLLGLLAAIVTGGLMGLLMAFVSVFGMVLYSAPLAAIYRQLAPEEQA